MSVERPATVSVRPDRPEYEFSSGPALAEVESGTTVHFETLDARSGTLNGHPLGESFELEPAREGTGNPLTGPVAVEGAGAEDHLVVEVIEIRCGSRAFTGGHAHVNPLGPGGIPASRGRILSVDGETVSWGQAGIELPARPMIGTIGVATAPEPLSSSMPGRHGGNLDHTIIGPGARVHLPIAVEGAMLSLGDVHATQGDGELSGVAAEVAAEVVVELTLARSLPLSLPWVETADRIAVLTSATDFVEARREAVQAMVDLVCECLDLEPAEALALISMAGDLRFGQAFGGPIPLTLRLEMPRLPGLRLPVGIHP